MNTGTTTECVRSRPVRLNDVSIPRYCGRCGQMGSSTRSLTLADAAKKLEAWRKQHNGVWPHGANNNRPPIALMILGETASRSP